MSDAKVSAGPDKREPVVVSEQHAVLARAGQHPPDDVGHAVVQLVSERRRAVVARDAQAVARGQVT